MKAIVAFTLISLATEMRWVFISSIWVTGSDTGSVASIELNLLVKNVIELEFELSMLY